MRRSAPGTATRSGRNPTVSICIPTYNGAKFLEETLASVLAQTFEDYEVVISDDASGDDTLEIAERFRAAHPDKEIRIEHHAPNGIGANWNNSIRHARGDYIKLLMQDDILYPACLERMVAALEGAPSAVLTFSRRDILYEFEDEAMHDWLLACGELQDGWSFEMNEGVHGGKTLLGCPRLFDRPSNKIGEPTVVMFRRDVFDRLGGFDEKLRQNLDYEFWYRALTLGDAVFIEEPLAAFRRHADQATETNKAIPQAAIFERRRFRMKVFRHLFWYVDGSVKLRLLNGLLREITGRSYPRLVYPPPRPAPLRRARNLDLPAVAEAGDLNTS